MSIYQLHKSSMKYSPGPKLFPKLFLETSSKGSPENFSITLADNPATISRIKLSLPKNCPIKSNQVIVERFIRTVKEEFISIAFRKKLYTSVDLLQQDFDDWLYHYNYLRPHRGYRNMGKRPIDTVNAFVKKENKTVRHQG